MIGRTGTRSPVLGAFAWGAAAAFVASRILPPLIAQVAGAARASRDGDPFAALIVDHRHMVSLLTRMERSGAADVLDRTQLLMRLKRQMTAHALAEEDVVYPMLHDDAHAEDDAKKLYSEHARMKILLHALEQMPKDDPEWPQRASALRELVESHARQEEEIEFPRLRTLMSDNARARLAGQVHREKAMVL